MNIVPILGILLASAVLGAADFGKTLEALRTAPAIQKYLKEDKDYQERKAGGNVLDLKFRKKYGEEGAREWIRAVAAEKNADMIWLRIPIAREPPVPAPRIDEIDEDLIGAIVGFTGMRETKASLVKLANDALHDGRSRELFSDAIKVDFIPGSREIDLLFLPVERKQPQAGKP